MLSNCRKVALWFYQFLSHALKTWSLAMTPHSFPLHISRTCVLSSTVMARCLLFVTTERYGLPFVFPGSLIRWGKWYFDHHPALTIYPLRSDSFGFGHSSVMRLVSIAHMWQFFRAHPACEWIGIKRYESTNPKKAPQSSVHAPKTSCEGASRTYFGTDQVWLLDAVLPPGLYHLDTGACSKTDTFGGGEKSPLD